MVYPDEEKFLKDREKYNVIPVYKEINGDMETPVSIFMKTRASLLLESVESAENVGRYSIITRGKIAEMVLQGEELKFYEFENGKEKNCQNYRTASPFSRIRDYFSRFRVAQYPGLPPFFAGAIGYLGYETVGHFEKVPVKSNGNEVPDGIIQLPETFIIYDSVKRSIFIIIPVLLRGPEETEYSEVLAAIAAVEKEISLPLKHISQSSDKQKKKHKISEKISRENFIQAVKKCKQYIKDGEIIQVVISNQFKLETGISPFEIYRSLRVLNPSPYLFFLDFGAFCLIGSSPEVMVRVQNQEILLKPIAGTKRRGATIEEDKNLASELLHDSKEKAEHLMLVDLGRNDLGRIAKPGSVEVTDFMKIEKYSHVMHIVSTIKARLDAKFDVFDVIEATFPAGTLTGAPKIRAMEIISEIESSPRGPYGGMVFNLGFNQSLDSCITIRTILLKDNIALIQAGAGIVAGSIPESEYEETVNKADALICSINSAGGRK